VTFDRIGHAIAAARATQDEDTFIANRTAGQRSSFGSVIDLARALLEDVTAALSRHRPPRSERRRHPPLDRRAHVR
jgi:hypothetical protein